jgi:predicted choloylglycine hydrolase
MKRLAIWTGLIAGSWALALGVVMCARQALAQSPIPESMTNEAIKGVNEGGFKAVAYVALAGVVAMGFFVVFLIRVILQLVGKLETLSTRSTDVAARSEEAIELNTRFLEQAKAKLGV